VDDPLPNSGAKKPKSRTPLEKFKAAGKLDFLTKLKADQHQRLRVAMELGIDKTKCPIRVDSDSKAAALQMMKDVDSMASQSILMLRILPDLRASLPKGLLLSR
jgi:hypothetical protein